MPLLLAANGPYGPGTIDNLVLQPVVHNIVGAILVVVWLALSVYLVVLAVRRKPYDRTAKILVIAAEVMVMIQALLGIKLLDQNLGVNQLYIHYVGGLIPLGLLIVASWFSYKNDPVLKARVLSVVCGVGFLSALMAYTIGQAFVNRAGG